MIRNDAMKWADTTANQIVFREGRALALAARNLDDAAVGVDTSLLAVAIAKAIMQAYDAGTHSPDEL